jgi:hypothetical protein
LVTVNRDGSPQVSVVWMVVQSTADGDDQLVTAHLHEHQKIRNIRRDPLVAATIVSTDRSGPQTPNLSIKGMARVEEGGAPPTIDRAHHGDLRPRHQFPAARLTTRIPDPHHDRKGRRCRAMGILTA